MGIILELKNILKIYPNGVIACNKASLKVEKGTIHAIIGENGAGKTTLMKIISGLEMTQEGEIYYKRKKIEIRNPFDAIKIGIGMIHQHFMLVQNLTVAQNLVLGIEPGKLGFLNVKKMKDIASEISKKYGLGVPIDEKVIDIPMGIRQKVEILKALLRNSEILILDEPTSMITPQETEQLFATIRNLKSMGKTIIFISHKLKEVKAIADVISIMQRGKVIFTGDIKELSEEEISHLMVGRNIFSKRVEKTKCISEEVLSVEKLKYLNKENRLILNSVSFDLRRGEILGIAGIDGNGQEELVQILMGFLKSYNGTVRILGKETLNKSPREIMEMKVSCIPKDKLKYGVAEDASLLENLIVNKYYKNPFLRWPILNKGYILKYDNNLIKSFSIEMSKLESPVRNLSGGNIQKVILARVLLGENNVIIAHEPAQGLDIGATEIVHKLLVKVRDQGAGILLISPDLDELLELSTRIIVLYNGKIVANFDNLENISPRDIGPYMVGAKDRTKEVEKHNGKNIKIY